MSRFEPIFKKLKKLQTEFQEVMNQFWSVKSTLAASREAGHQADDFLPRRLRLREKEIQDQFKLLDHKLHRMLERYFGEEVLAVTSSQDLETIQHITQTMRYIHNAFVGEPPVRHTLARLNATLAKAYS